MNKQTSGDTWPCPYHLCQANPLIVGAEHDKRIRSHKYEGYTVCPGTGYYLNKPAMEQDKLMAERAVKARLPRGIHA